MTSSAAGRATPRQWALAALAGLALLAAGLVQVILGSRGQLLHLLVGTVLSVAVMAATAWWAFTTRRVWKRWLNIAIAALAVANIVLGFIEFGFRQATGALAIVIGALVYATATPRALRTAPSTGSEPGGLWTAPSTGPGPGLASPTGGPDDGGSGCGLPAHAVTRQAVTAAHSSRTNPTRNRMKVQELTSGRRPGGGSGWRRRRSRPGRRA